VDAEAAPANEHAAREAIEGDVEGGDSEEEELFDL
jgi:hypothetical protein